MTTPLDTILGPDLEAALEMAGYAIVPTSGPILDKALADMIDANVPFFARQSALDGVKNAIGPFFASIKAALKS